MKKISGIITIVALFALSACNNSPDGKKAETGEALANTTQITNATTYELQTDESLMGWMGAKPTGKHHGTINFKMGFLKVSDGDLVGGTIMVDMKSIENEDLKDKPEYQEKLVKHLKSGDFFDVNSFPEALFEIVSVEKNEDPATIDGITTTHKISGNLTIKGITKSIAFNAKVDKRSDVLTAEAPQFIIDRTDWDIKYKSNKFFPDLKDQFINDEVGISFKLKAKKRS